MTVRIITFKIEEELLNEIDKLCNELGMTRSELIRFALMALVSGKKVRIKKVRVE